MFTATFKRYMCIKQEVEALLLTALGNTTFNRLVFGLWFFCASINTCALVKTWNYAIQFMSVSHVSGVFPFGLSSFFQVFCGTINSSCYVALEYVLKLVQQVSCHFLKLCSHSYAAEWTVDSPAPKSRWGWFCISA